MSGHGKGFVLGSACHETFERCIMADTDGVRTEHGGVLFAVGGLGKAVSTGLYHRLHTSFEAFAR